MRGLMPRVFLYLHMCMTRVSHSCDTHGPFKLWVICTVPWVSRSAGLSADGQYLHSVEIDLISLTQLLTNGLSVFLLLIHERTIWLSGQNKILVVRMDVDINTCSHASSTAAINSSLGKVCCLRGAALAFDMSIAD